MSWQCDSYCLQVWEVVAQSLAAIGTFSAVVASLWLARRQGVRLKITAVPQVTITKWPDGRTETKTAINVVIRNTGYIDTIISAISWRTVLAGRVAIQLLLAPGMTKLPQELKAQHRLIVTIPEVDRREGWSDSFFKVLLPRWPGLFVYFVRVIVETAGGQRFSAPIGLKLRRFLLEQLAKG